MEADPMNKTVVPNDMLLSEVGKLVDEGEKVVIMTKGISMLPFIHGGKDSVLLVKPSSVDVGDIVLARINDERYVLHRVISREGDRFVLMGDGNLRGVERCNRKDISAVAVKILKKNGKIVDCCSIRHRRRAAFWAKLLPVRRWLLAIYRRII